MRLLTILLAALLYAAHVRADPPRNVLLYVVDDQGSTDAGCYGNPVIRTPGLDTLAADGMRFDNAFCTTASCSASRSVILSGLHNHRTGQYGHEHSYNHFVSFENFKSLPVRLTKAGYRTMRAGKYHVAPESVYQFGAQLRVPGGSRAPVDMAQACRDFIADDSGTPFFLYFCTTEPHRPFHRDGSHEVNPADVIVPPYLPDTQACREELAQYYGSVERADAGLLTLIEILKETGHYDNTLVLFISDNGIAFPGAKTTLYEPGMKLPCVVRDPDQPEGGRHTSALVHWPDLTPTILDWTQTPYRSTDFHGRSFRAVLADPDAPGYDEVYASHTFHEITMYYPMRVVRERRYKLLWNLAHPLEYPFASDLHASATWQDILATGATHYGKRSIEAYLHRPAFELYDLDNDPHEIENLADDPAHAETLARLQGKLRDFQERTQDPWILKWEYE